MVNEPKKNIYAVVLMRTDGNNIFVESENFEQAYSKWAEYRDHWTQSLHDKKPFIVTEKDSGIVTAFDPAFVYEIIIRKMDSDLKVGANNPYYKEMVEKGFTNTFKNNTNNSGPDLLDRGFKL